MAFEKVPDHFPVYGGWTKSEILTEIAKIDTRLKARKAGEQRIVNASLNGASFSYASASGPDGLADLRSEKAALVEALAWVDDSVTVASSTESVVFT